MDNEQFTVSSTNSELISSSRSYSVLATFKFFDSEVQAEENGVINFVDPCVVPFDFSPVVTPNPESDNFSGNAITV